MAMTRLLAPLQAGVPLGRGGPLVKRILIGLIVLLVVVVAAVAFSVDRIVSQGIERGGSYALGVQTRVGFVRLRLLDGSFRLRGLRVENPPGFDQANFLQLGSAAMDVELGTLRQDVDGRARRRTTGRSSRISRASSRVRHQQRRSPPARRSASS
jgi:hypothetical protein